MRPTFRDSLELGEPGRYQRGDIDGAGIVEWYYFYRSLPSTFPVFSHIDLAIRPTTESLFRYFVVRVEILSML
jgi:hypothetical protein